ncbi:MAG TPA: FtsX-like permease family protein [Steroidobacteraceae bacterium]|jgi:putative ABC transport system permease protein|nr:FtsX-like permease family protein [Steroidobacteraceae bacterium]
MRFLPLFWSGIWRKPGRTVLIFFQVSVAFALFGMLQGLKTGVDHAVAAARADLLIVHSRLNFFAASLPSGSIEQIKSAPGVRLVVPVDIFGAHYQEPTEGLGVVAIGLVKDWPLAFTYSIAPNYLAAFQKLRTGTLINDALAKKYGWKVGDRIPLMSNTAQVSGSTNWAFDIVGTFSDSDLGGGRYTILINLAYLDEARALGKGTVQHFNVAISDSKQAATVADEIDRRFANSPGETKTESLQELAQSQMQAIGDMNFLIRAIVAAALVALLFATATMMIQSVRERTLELAVLKTVGFTDRAVFLLILAEALLICIAAAALGLAVATAVLPLAARFVLGLTMPKIVLAMGLAFAVVVALISAAIPAALAGRLKVAAALAGG